MADLNAVLTTIGTAVSGATAAAVPLYFLFRGKQLELRKQLNTLKLDEAEVDKKVQIDNEAEWKRIIDMYASNSGNLQAKIVELEKKCDNLLDRFIASERSNAGKDEQIKMLEHRVDNLTELLSNRCPECPSLTSLIQRTLSKSTPLHLVQTGTKDE